MLAGAARLPSISGGDRVLYELQLQTLAILSGQSKVVPSTDTVHEFLLAGVGRAVCDTATAMR